MTDLPEERRLFREAADLAIRLQNDPGNPVAVEMIRAWTARSPLHAAAWSRVAIIHGLAGKVFSDQRQAAEAGSAGLSRRSLVLGGAIGLGALAAGSWAVPRAHLYAKADYTTSTGEIRRIVLEDGTVTTLGPDSAIALGYTATRRSVELLEGMAFFEVAKFPDRPFSARTGSFSATALGTAFDLSNDDGFVSISVEQGMVEARGYDAEEGTPERLSAGDWITFGSPGTLTRGTREETQIAAWRSGMVMAEQEAVSAVVARIARWQSGSVVIATPALGSRVVSGVFDLGDPIRALAAVVRPFGAQVRNIAPFLTVISPV